MDTKLALGITAALLIGIIPLSICEEQPNTPPAVHEQTNQEKPQAKSADSDEKPNRHSVISFVPVRAIGPTAFGARKGDNIDVIFVISNKGGDTVHIARDTGFTLLSAGQTFVGIVEDLPDRQKPPLPEKLSLAPNQAGGFEVGFHVKKAQLAKQWKIKATFIVDGSNEPIHAEISSDDISIEER